jgi:hypothetical protein
MDFRIVALESTALAAMHELDDLALRAAGARRLACDATPGMPCRVSLQDALPGESVLLINRCHLDVDTPYRATGPVYVREGAVRASPAPGEVPPMLRLRLLSLRAYDAKGYLRDADAVPGTALEPALRGLLAAPRIARVQIHFAKTGCFACEAFPVAA